MHAIIKPASPFLNPGLTHLSHILAVVHLARSGNPRSQDTFAQIHKTQIQIWMVWLTWGSHWWCTWSSLEIPGHKVQRLIGRVGCIRSWMITFQNTCWWNGFSAREVTEWWAEVIQEIAKSTPTVLGRMNRKWALQRFLFSWLFTTSTQCEITNSPHLLSTDGFKEIVHKKIFCKISYFGLWWGVVRHSKSVKISKSALFAQKK